MAYKTKKNICETITAGDTVEIVPEYEYIFGQRVKEFMDLKPGQVAIKKVESCLEAKTEISIARCSRNDLYIVK